MKQFLRSVSLLTALSFSSLCLAQTPAPLQPVPPGDDRIVPVKAGAPTPFDGQLFDTTTAIRWGNYLQQCRVRLQADVQLQQKTDQAQIDFLNQEVKILNEKYDTVTTQYQKQLQSAEDALKTGIPWYDTMWFGLVVGLTGALILGGATAWVIHETK